ncbi:hypothetical protein ACFQPG_10400 [Sphingomonas sp. GCM10030256]|uniref:hypothetical protein n=1 Tax=Sphingomonas sp. GCM10030256 TaxID=3273427 RepID=UPI003616F94A
MTIHRPRTTAAILSLFTSLSALSAFVLATPVQAEPRSAALRDRIAESCAASDVDLVGKRLARQCRAALWEQARAGRPQLVYQRRGKAIAIVALR